MLTLEPFLPTHGAMEDGGSPWTLGGLSFSPVKAHPGALKTYPGALKAHSGAMEAHPGAV
jgi:hypothetical protein